MRKDPRETERALWAVASEQGGYFTAKQALAQGYTYRQQHFHRERGNWLLIDRGLFRLRDFPSGPHEDLIRWSFWSRDRGGKIRAVVSHESALALHELGDIMPAKLHLTVPFGFRKKPSGGCVLHRAMLNDTEIERREGYFITTPMRSILDVANSDLSPEHLVKALRDALVRGLVQRKRLLEVGVSPRVKHRLSQAVGSVQEASL